MIIAHGLWLPAASFQLLVRLADKAEIEIEMETFDAGAHEANDFPGILFDVFEGGREAPPAGRRSPCIHWFDSIF